MTDVTIFGKILDETAERDAVHIAVAPVIVATARLYPGEHVGLIGLDSVAKTDKPIGIIDPFLSHPVMEGDRCWLFLYQNTITSLRHRWEHPAFGAMPVPSAAAKGNAAVSASQTWMREFAERYDKSYDAMLRAAGQYLDNGDYIRGGSEMEGECVPDEFWAHYERITGKAVSGVDRGNFFSCSC